MEGTTDMKKISKSLVIGLVALLLVIVAANSAYTVRENQYACTVRFSKIISTTAQPGLHFKVPFLDSVKYFSKASMLYDIPPSEVLTSDKQNMTVDCYIHVEDVKIKRFDLPESNLNAVYSRMISERNQMAEKYTADGNYEASIIRNNVDKQVNILISDAKAEAAKLEADGEGEYMRLLGEAYNTADKQDFYEFTQALEALKSSLTGDEKTVILDADSALGKILMGAYGN